MALVVPSANLTDETIASSFDQLLFLDNVAGILEATLKIVSTDLGRSALQIAAEKVAIQAADSDPTNQVELFRVNDKDGAVILDVDGTNKRVGVGTATPGALLEVEQGASGADVAFIIDNNDTDMVAMSIEAANIDADVIDISADAVTTHKVIDITADALTSGNMLYLDDNSSSTTARNCVSIIQNNDAALEATALLVQSDAGGTGMKIDKNYPAALVAADTITGLHVDFDHTVPSSGTATQTDIGIDLDVNSATLGTSTTYGMDIDVVGATSGTHTAIGLDVSVSGADTNYAALFNGGNVGIGTTAPTEMLVVNNSSGDATIRVASSGAANDSSIYLGQSNDTGITMTYDGGDDKFYFIDQTPATLMTISNSTGSVGNVGIGTSSPTSNLTVVRDLASGSTTYPVALIHQTNTGDDQPALEVLQDADSTFAFRVKHTDADNPNGIKIQYSGGAPNTADTDFFISAIDTGATRFYVSGNGDVETTTGTDIAAISDERMKENIADYTGGLAIVNALSPKTFTWKSSVDRGMTGTRYGFIAQEIQAISDVKDNMGLVRAGALDVDDPNYDAIMALCPDGIINKSMMNAQQAVLVSAIQELSAKVTALENA